MQIEVFDSARIYDDTDEELDLIAPRNKRAQWRHRRIGPNYLKMGRRVKYVGADLNSWISSNRITTQQSSAM